jgi:hypothetical protein
MTERLTERDLAEIAEDMESDHCTAYFKILEAEIHRLRGIIASLPRDVPENDQSLEAGMFATYCCACVFCGNSDPEKHEATCPWPAFQAEADAIAEEEKPATPEVKIVGAIEGDVTISATFVSHEEALAADARAWFGHVAMAATPHPEPGATYVYQARVAWDGKGGVIVAEETLEPERNRVRRAPSENE